MIIRDSTVDNKIKHFFSDILHVLFNDTYLMANFKFSRLWGLGYMDCFASVNDFYNMGKNRRGEGDKKATR